MFRSGRKRVTRAVRSDAPTARKPATRHRIIRSTQGIIFIVSSLSTRDDTQVITIDPLCGYLIYEGRIGADLFENEKAAEEYLFRVRRVVIKDEWYACAIIGYVPPTEGAHGLLGIVTDVRSDEIAFHLHTVNTVADAQWIKVSRRAVYRAFRWEHIDQEGRISSSEISVWSQRLVTPSHVNFSSPSKAEQQSIQLIESFTIPGLHFFCETHDITRPFPSEHAVHDCDPEFRYNSFLAEPFEAAGLREWCCVLLQGCATSRQPVCGGSFLHATLITRKSCLNAGTRYRARGMNARFSPGNEMEGELILSTRVAIDDQSVPKGADTRAVAVHFVTHVWRRGTVPVWWGTELRSSVAEPVIAIRRGPSGKSFHEGTQEYFEALKARYGTSAPITCLSLLKVGPDHAETQLVEAYQSAVRHIRANSATCSDLRLLNFDWHFNVKQLGLDTSVESLWHVLHSTVRSAGISEGTAVVEVPVRGGKGQQSARAARHGAAHAVADRGVARVQSMEVHERQNGIVRYNCADSLDRTNLCIFFEVMQLLVDMCDALGAGLTRPLRGDDETGEDAEPFALAMLRQILHAPLQQRMAEMFVEVGDVCSLLYTATPAMHTDAIRAFSATLSKAPNNTRLVLTRRFQNVVNDAVRQSQFDVFLGYNLDRLAPALAAARSGDAARVRCVSAFPAGLLKKLPSRFGESVSVLDQLLLHNDSGQRAVLLSEGAASADLFIVLPALASVLELALTIRRGRDETIAPSRVSVRAGRSFADLTDRLVAATVPRCTDGTRVYFSLSGGTASIARSGGTESSGTSAGRGSGKDDGGSCDDDGLLEDGASSRDRAGGTLNASEADEIALHVARVDLALQNAHESVSDASAARAGEASPMVEAADGAVELVADTPRAGPTELLASSAVASRSEHAADGVRLVHVHLAGEDSAAVTGLALGRVEIYGIPLQEAESEEKHTLGLLVSSMAAEREDAGERSMDAAPAAGMPECGTDPADTRDINESCSAAHNPPVQDGVDTSVEQRRSSRPRSASWARKVWQPREHESDALAEPPSAILLDAPGELAGTLPLAAACTRAAASTPGAYWVHPDASVRRTSFSLVLARPAILTSFCALPAPGHAAPVLAVHGGMTVPASHELASQWRVGEPGRAQVTAALQRFLFRALHVELSLPDGCDGPLALGAFTVAGFPFPHCVGAATLQPDQLAQYNQALHTTAPVPPSIPHALRQRARVVWHRIALGGTTVHMEFDRDVAVCGVSVRILSSLRAAQPRGFRVFVVPGMTRRTVGFDPASTKDRDSASASGTMTMPMAPPGTEMYFPMREVTQGSFCIVEGVNFSAGVMEALRWYPMCVS